MKPYANPIELLSWETGGTDGTNNDSGSGHYGWINNFSSFLARSNQQRHIIVTGEKMLG